MAGGASRRSVAIASSLVLHAALVALVAGQAIVRLDVIPATIDLSFLEASDRTAGPGETAPGLRDAAPAPPAAPATPPEPAREEPPEQEIAKPDPVPVPQPKRTAKKPLPVTPPRVSPKPAPAAPANTASANAASNAEASGGTGVAARATAPAWAPTARVRYESLLFAWMDRHKQYPMMAQRRGLEGDGSVRVRIDRDGRVLERSVTKSTGESMLDQAALDMVRRANPFPAVPAEYAGETFEFVAPIQYRLR